MLVIKLLADDVAQRISKAFRQLCGDALTEFEWKKSQKKYATACSQTDAKQVISDLRIPDCFQLGYHASVVLRELLQILL